MRRFFVPVLICAFICIAISLVIWANYEQTEAEKQCISKGGEPVRGERGTVCVKLDAIIK